MQEVCLSRTDPEMVGNNRITPVSMGDADSDASTKVRTRDLLITYPQGYEPCTVSMGHTMDFEGFVPSNFEGLVNLHHIRPSRQLHGGKLTFDERFVVHRADAHLPSGL